MGTKPIINRRLSGLERLCLAALLAPAMLCAASPAAAQTQTGQLKVAVLQPLSFIRVQDLDFGTMIAGTTAGVVRVQPNGTRTTTGGVTLVGNDQQVARFSGYGSYNQVVLISVSANTIQLTGPGAPMTVSQFEIGSSPIAPLTTAPLAFRIGATSGLFTFPLGARLAVGANQVPGTYSGTFAVTLNYQ
ncbi:MAG: DUF4402 domain-containing protein [Sphingopyxis sp.]